MDPRGFVNGDNYADIIPNGSMTYARQLNAVMRFSLYYAAAVSLARLSPESFVVPLAAAVVTYLLYEGCRPLEKAAMMRGGGLGGAGGGLDGGAGPDACVPATPYGICKPPKAGEDGSKSRGWLKAAAMGGAGGSAAGGWAGGGWAGGGASSCIRSTRDNPFMNQPPLDPEMFSKESCDPLRSEVKRQMRDNFQRDLFRDTDDLFERGNSERQFFTMPSNQPEDQTEFAKWIYGGENMGGRATKPPWKSGEPHPSGSGRACGYW
jgi:hypothetical protein